LDVLLGEINTLLYLGCWWSWLGTQDWFYPYDK